jgi:hypothetical protein
VGGPPFDPAPRHVPGTDDEVGVRGRGEQARERERVVGEVGVHLDEARSHVRAPSPDQPGTRVPARTCDPSTSTDHEVSPRRHASSVEDQRHVAPSSDRPALVVGRTASGSPGPLIGSAPADRPGDERRDAARHRPRSHPLDAAWTPSGRSRPPGAAALREVLAGSALSPNEASLVAATSSCAGSSAASTLCARRRGTASRSR